MNKNNLIENKIHFDSELFGLINESEKRLQMLSGSLALLKESDPIITFLIYREAQKSILISQPDFPVNDFYKDLIGESGKNHRVILNYADALLLGQKLIRNVSDSVHIIRSIHDELNKNISPGSTRAIPEDETLPQMDDLRKEISANISYPNAVRAAIIHARFDLLDPFKENSGATARILAQLLLLWKKQLPFPVLQLSGQLLKKKIEYTELLNDLKRGDNPERWIKFYLRTICDSSEETLLIIKNIFSMREEHYKIITEKEFASASVLKFLNLLLKRPVISLPFVTKELGFNKQNANTIIAKFLDENIIEEITGQKRNRLFTYKKYLNILEQDK